MCVRGSSGEHTVKLVTGLSETVASHIPSDLQSFVAFWTTITWMMTGRCFILESRSSSSSNAETEDSHQPGGRVRRGQSAETRRMNGRSRPVSKEARPQHTLDPDSRVRAGAILSFLTNAADRHGSRYGSNGPITPKKRTGSGESSSTFRTHLRLTHWRRSRKDLNKQRWPVPQGIVADDN